MSFQALAWAVKVKTGAMACKCVLLAISNYADENGKCWPSQARLAEDIEASEDTVRRALEKLESLGLITRERRSRKDGSRTSDYITLNLTSNLQDRNLTSNLLPPNPQIAGAILEPVTEPINLILKTRARSKTFKTSIPEMLDLNQTNLVLMETLQISKPEQADQFQIMRDWAANAGPKAKKQDWQAFYRNWFKSYASKRKFSNAKTPHKPIQPEHPATIAANKLRARLGLETFGAGT
jgi:DNA-binding transcriptional ArsR family regulator